MSSHDVHIWFRATDSLDHAAIAALSLVLCDEELAACRRFPNPTDARDYAAAHALLRTTLSRYGDRGAEQWRFGRGETGKPFLIAQDASPISFSLSHTRGMVACAVTQGGAIGVDVECVDREVDVGAIAARFFASSEIAQLASLNPEAQRQRFFALWTLKEALTKALDVGMAGSLNALVFAIDPNGHITREAPTLDHDGWQFALFTPGPRHLLAIAANYLGDSGTQLIFHDGGVAAR